MSERNPETEMVDLLPDEPAPRSEAREHAIGAALSRFDAGGCGRERDVKGFGEVARHRSRQGSWRPSVMIPTRSAIAATALVLVAAPIAWQIAREREAELPMEQAEAPAPPVSDAVKPPAAVEPQRDAAPAPIVAAPPPVLPATPETAQQAQALPMSPQPVPGSAKIDATRSKNGQELTRALPSIVPAPRVAPTVSREQLQAFRSSGGAEFGGGPRTMELGIRQRGELRENGPGDSEQPGRDRFDAKAQSGFKTVREVPVSTFSIDVDTASYGFVRGSLNRNVLPSPDAVRTEELVNYFPYGYEAPKGAETPFKVTASVFPSPWANGRKIVRIGVKGYELAPAARPPANLVFLIDTSGSMNAPNRLPLVKQSLALLLTKLDAHDRVAIVTYAGQAGTALEPTPASDKQKILSAIEGLGAGGGTAGGEGLRQAYALAERNFDPAAVNRVMLATDGDFNIGISDRDELKGFVERKRETGIFLSVLGFGMGNYNDALMQALAQNGNGTAAYIDTLNEARKTLVEEAGATLFPIAKDVKLQVEFNPATVAEYRLIGYETRALNRDDFSNDKVDAGEVGSGQTATALYEIVPAGGPSTVAALRYGEAKAPQASTSSGEYAFVKIRYKLPKEDVSRLIETPVGPPVERPDFAQADDDARFATAVAGFGELLRGGKWTGKFALDDALKIATASRGEDAYGYRTEFLHLVRAAKTAQALQSSRQ